MGKETLDEVQYSFAEGTLPIGKSEGGIALILSEGKDQFYLYSRDFTYSDFSEVKKAFKMLADYDNVNHCGNFLFKLCAEVVYWNRRREKEIERREKGGFLYKLFHYRNLFRKREPARIIENVIKSMGEQVDNIERSEKD